MKHLIDKAAVVAKIEKELQDLIACKENSSFIEHRVVLQAKIDMCNEILSFLDTPEVKEEEEYKQPEYSCMETVYRCGKKPCWNLGDTLAYYEFYSDREGECVLGKVTKVEFDKEQSDWFYTFEDGSVCDEQLLLKEETYKKN